MVASPVVDALLTLALAQGTTAVEAVSPADRALFEPELRILHEFVGEAAGDQFGWLGRNVGDCDRDGVNDVGISAPTKAIGGPAAGRLYVYSGKSGKVLFTHDGQPGDQLGNGIEGAGDVNADGFPDVVAGAPGAAGGRGQVVVLSGKDGSLLRTLTGEKPGQGFGKRACSVGDANGDGCADLLVSADLCDEFGAGLGRALVYSGKDGSLLLSLDGEQPGDKFGLSLCGETIGGSTWLVIGAADAGERKGGRVYAFEWKSGHEAELAWTLEADETGAELAAMFLSFVGDLDGDGFPDVYASDWQNRVNGSAGRVYLCSGRSGKTLYTLSGTHPGEGLGIGTADIGDVDGDGRADLLIGAWQNAEGAKSGGKCTLFSGAEGRELASWVCTRANETFGFDTTGMGDVDGDGATDYLITNAWSGIAGNQSGRAFLVAGPRFSPPAENHGTSAGGGR